MSLTTTVPEELAEVVQEAAEKRETADSEPVIETLRSHRLTIPPELQEE